MVVVEGQLRGAEVSHPCSHMHCLMSRVRGGRGEAGVQGERVEDTGTILTASMFLYVS